MAHNIFISWSGPTSQEIAEILHEWIGEVIQSAHPFMSDKSIDAGKRGLDEISTNLTDIKVGLIVVTAQNQNSPWLNFEAGAPSKLLDQDTYVIPLAFDLEAGQVKLPLGQFQAKQFTYDDMLHVVTVINKALSNSLTPDRLQKAFDKNWVEFEADITRIREQPIPDEALPCRGVEDMLEELVVASREQGEHLKLIKHRPLRTDAMNAQYVAAELVISKLETWYGEGKALTLKRIGEMHEQFDQDDWDLIETSPFLLWYLKVYHGVTRTDPAKAVAEDIDDLPF